MILGNSYDTSSSFKMLMNLSSIAKYGEPIKIIKISDESPGACTITISFFIFYLLRSIFQTPLILESYFFNVSLLL